MFSSEFYSESMERFTSWGMCINDACFLVNSTLKVWLGLQVEVWVIMMHVNDLFSSEFYSESMARFISWGVCINDACFLVNSTLKVWKGLQVEVCVLMMHVF